MRRFIAALTALFLSVSVAYGGTSKALGNANYNVLTSDTLVFTSIPLSASRTVTLPYASSSCVGTQQCQTPLLIVDQLGTVTSTNTIVVTPQSGDTINGSSSAITINVAYGQVALFPLGGSNWYTTVNDASGGLGPFLPLAGGSMTGSIGFSATNTIDIGTSATVLAPRTVYAGTSFVGPTGSFTTCVQVGGATCGANALAVTGTANISGLITGGAGGTFSGEVAALDVLFNGNAYLTSPTTSTIQQGAADNASASPQIFRTHSIVAGTAATSAGNWTFIGGLPTGTGTSGDIIFQTGVKTGSGTTQGTATTALTIKGETQIGLFATGLSLGSTSVNIVPATWTAGHIGVQNVSGGGGNTFFDVYPQAGTSNTTQDVGFTVAAIGSPTSISTYQLMEMKFDHTNGEFAIDSIGSGTILPINIYTSGHRNQIVANINGSVGLGGTTTITGSLTVSALGNAATTSAVCYNTGTGVITYNSTVGTCTVSTIAAKNLVDRLSDKDGYDLVMALQPWRYNLKEGRPTFVVGEQIGLVAEDVAKIDPRLVAANPDGSIAGVRYEQYTAALTAAIHHLAQKVERLETLH